MKLSVGFSPCPNDTFIFDALVNKKINTGNLEFEIVLADVQQLNQWALQQQLDISKISYAVLPLVLDKYTVLNSGGALGKGVGPLLISNSGFEIEDWSNTSVAVPGENTTANMLFSLAYPQATNKKFMLFSDIENAVINKEVDCGVIIHENRFTYQQKGLKKIKDLGEYWEETTKNPIPLGGIIAKRSLDKNIILQVDQLIRESIEYAFRNYPLVTDYVRAHSQEMDENVMRQHIDLYVNNYSISLGEEGRSAVKKMLQVSGYPNDKDIFIS